MDPIGNIISMLLKFLLQFLELFVTFVISALQLLLSFARAVVGMVL